MDRKNALGLLDMSAEFDCVEHPILLHRLQIAVGIGDAGLDWSRSFWSGRTQQVLYSGERAIGYAGVIVWRFTGLGARTVAVRPLHGSAA
jgi:hypothetical protein